MGIQKKIYLYAALLLFLGGHSRISAAEDSDYHEPVDLLKKVEEKTTEAGVKVGMTKEQALKLLGDQFSEEKPPSLEPNEKILTWNRPNKDIVTVTFDGDKVKAVSHSIIAKEETK